MYVDDMLVKSHTSRSHVDNVRETFATLYKYQIKLNPTKCAFGVTSKKILRFMVSHQGIETNPKKIQAVRLMVAPKITKEVQKLTRHGATQPTYLSID